MNRVRTTLAGIGVITALVAAGCGSDQAGVQPLSGSPHQQVLTAVENLGNGDTLTGQVHLGADARSLLTFASRVSHGGMTAKQAQALAGASLSFTVHSTDGSLQNLATSSNPKSEQADVTFTDQGRRYAELRSVSGNLFLQADVKGIIELVGQPDSVYNRALAQVKQLPAFATDFLTGKWVEVPGTQLQQFSKKLRQKVGPSTFPSPNPAQRQAFLSSLQKLFAKDVTVKQTRRTTGGGSYTLSANTRQLATTFFSSLTRLEPALTGQMSRLPTSQIPSRTITFGAQVAGGKLSRLSFDFAQLSSQQGVPNLPLDVDFSTASQTVTAPTGATVIDLQKLFQMLLMPSETQLHGSLHGSAGAGANAPQPAASPVTTAATLVLG